MSITDAVRGSYLAHWGPPSRTATFEVDGLTAEVWKWSSEVSREGVDIYSTIGASVWPLADLDPNHRVEFFVGLRPAKDEIASPLAALALYPAREGVALEHGHTVPLGAPLWPGSDMRRLLILRPLGEVIMPLELPGDLHVEFLQAIPIFESELVYKKTHTAEGLLRRWEELRVPFWNPDRSLESAFG